MCLELSSSLHTKKFRKAVGLSFHRYYNQKEGGLIRAATPLLLIGRRMATGSFVQVAFELFVVACITTGVVVDVVRKVFQKLNEYVSGAA
mmetsp:Transcript_39560/g.79895  ORF Transcript_39560/g.79895 Transcript_39560/m.79895 type:complete len:90 (+) Transcript_39560:114-383(+)